MTLIQKYYSDENSRSSVIRKSLQQQQKFWDYLSLFGKRKGHKRSYQYCNHLPTSTTNQWNKIWCVPTNKNDNFKYIFRKVVRSSSRNFFLITDDLEFFHQNNTFVYVSFLITGERRILKQIIVLLTFNFYIKRTNECRQHKRKDRNIWHQHRVSRKVWFSHNFFLFTPPPPPHSQKRESKRHQKRAQATDDETVGLMKLHRPPTEERRTQSVCVVEEGEHRM